MVKPLLMLFAFLTFAKHPVPLPDSKLATNVRATVWPRLLDQLHDQDLANANSIYLRIFKQEHMLEVWVKNDKQYQLFKSYPICYFSGGLGTKTHVNDGKSPEGFYTLTAGQLNPVSNYHLALNIGYPNQLEKAKGYTGDAIMIHGNCASIGCYAMTDPQIEEIYTLVYKALQAGQKTVQLHIYPFRLRAANLQAYATSPFHPLWKNMKIGYDLFEASHIPPTVYVANKT